MVKFLEAVKRGVDATLFPMLPDYPRDEHGQIVRKYEGRAWTRLATTFLFWVATAITAGIGLAVFFKVLPTGLNSTARYIVLGGSLGASVVLFMIASAQSATHLFKNLQSRNCFDPVNRSEEVTCCFLPKRKFYLEKYTIMDPSNQIAIGTATQTEKSITIWNPFAEQVIVDYED